MKKLRLSKTSRTSFLTYAMVIVLFVALQVMANGGMLSSSLKGQLVPICAYVVMALSLNLTVGILGELSLGHAGFMSVGAFAGAVAASALQTAIPLPGLLWLLFGGISYTVGAVFYGFGKKYRYVHSVFHFFVLLGSIMQFICILFYVI